MKHTRVCLWPPVLGTRRLGTFTSALHELLGSPQWWDGTTVACEPERDLRNCTL